MRGMTRRERESKKNPKPEARGKKSQSQKGVRRVGRKRRGRSPGGKEATKKKKA